MTEIPDLKLCCRCHQWKPHSEFYKNRFNRDGLHSYCKQCNAQCNRESAPFRSELAKQRHREQSREWNRRQRRANNIPPRALRNTPENIKLENGCQLHGNCFACPEKPDCIFGTAEYRHLLKERV